MNCRNITRCMAFLSRVGAVCTVLSATAAAAQEVLPFPPPPSGSKAGLTMEDSTYKKRVEPRHLAEARRTS